MFTKNYWTLRTLSAIEPIAGLSNSGTYDLSNVRNRIIPWNGTPIVAKSGYDRFNGFSSTQYMDNHIKLAKADMRYDTSYNSSSPACGIILGTGTTPPTIDDYAMAGDHVTTYSLVTAKTNMDDENGIQTELLWTINNTGTEDITIGEIGYFGYVYQQSNTTSSRYYWYHILLERSTLEAPITIAPNGVGQITYRIRANYPTA